MTDPGIPATDLGSRAIQAAERLYARMDSLDRTVQADVRRDIETLLDLARRADSALVRIAQSEEQRALMMREEAQERREAAHAATARRDAWATRLWSHPAVQLLITALMLGIMQMIGMSWFATSIAPSLIPPAPVVHQQDIIQNNTGSDNGINESAR